MWPHAEWDAPGGPGHRASVLGDLPEGLHRPPTEVPPNNPLVPPAAAGHRGRSVLRSARAFCTLRAKQRPRALHGLQWYQRRTDPRKGDGGLQLHLGMRPTTKGGEKARGPGSSRREPSPPPRTRTSPLTRLLLASNSSPRARGRVRGAAKGKNLPAGSEQAPEADRQGS